MPPVRIPISGYRRSALVGGIRQSDQLPAARPVAGSKPGTRDPSGAQTLEAIQGWLSQDVKTWPQPSTSRNSRTVCSWP